MYPHGDENLAPHELGASIFVDANQNLMKAVKVRAKTRVCLH